jgi:hypothetical protein
VTYASTPDSGFIYRTGVKNIKKVMSTVTIFPISLKTPFKSAKIKLSPSVSKKSGSISIGINRIVDFGAIPK